MEFDQPQLISQVLIDLGADLEATTNEGWTPLIRASYDSHSEIVEVTQEVHSMC